MVMKKFTVIVVLCCFLLNTGILSAQEAKSSREQTIKDLVDELDMDRDIMVKIPGLKVKKDTDGKEYYSYTAGEKETRLEDLDEDTLEDLLTKAYNEGQNLRDREIMEQTETLRQTRNAMQESTNVRNVQSRTRNIPASVPRK